MEFEVIRSNRKSMTIEINQNKLTIKAPNDGNRIILTNGFVKKTQKTPESEKKLAKKYKADYERRHPNE